MIIARAIVILSSVLNRAALWGAVLAVGVMVSAALWQVVARYLFASPPIWTEELARYAMVWAGMLGASCAFHAAADPVLFPGAVAASGNKGIAAAVLRLLAVLTFCGPVLWFCFIGPNGTWIRGFIARSLSRNADMLGIPMFWIALAIPVAFSLISLHAVADVVRRTLPVSARGERNA
jgi:TRAP-type C4-dicarboxylate transport system permease small subunit